MTNEVSDALRRYKKHLSATSCSDKSEKTLSQSPYFRYVGPSHDHWEWDTARLRADEQTLAAAFVREAWRLTV